MKKLKFTLILQARLKSTRLPEKVLKKLDNYEIVIFLQKRLLNLNKFIDHFILAVPQNEVDIFKNYKVDDFKIEGGSEENVLERFAHSFKKYESDYLIRVTSDNPFTSLIILHENINLLNQFYNKGEILPDYLVRENLPIGTQTEIIKKEAFWENYKKASKTYHFEHVTPYIYENEKYFKILRVPYNKFKKIAKLRLTIDTLKDYIVAQNIVKNYKNKTKPYYLIDLNDIDKIYHKYKDQLEMNKDEIQKNFKQ